MGMRNVLRILSLVAVVAVLAACGGTDDGATSSTTAGDGAPEEGGADDAVLGRTWVLDALTVDGEDATAEGGSVPTVSFTAEGEVSGSGPCNQYFGSYVRDGESVEIAGLGWTEMACLDQSVMEAETAFFDALATVTTMAVVDGRLVLDGPGARFEWVEAAPVPDAALEGTVWELDTFVDGGLDGAASSTVAGTEVTLVVEGSQVSGNAGCNSYSGEVAVDGDRFTVGPLAQTFKLCNEPAGVTDQETRFLERLGGVTTWSVEGARLTLTADDGAGLSFRAAGDADPAAQE